MSSNEDIKHLANSVPEQSNTAKPLNPEVANQEIDQLLTSIKKLVGNTDRLLFFAMKLKAAEEEIRLSDDAAFLKLFSPETLINLLSSEIDDAERNGAELSISKSSLDTAKVSIIDAYIKRALAFLDNKYESSITQPEEIDEQNYQRDIMVIKRIKDLIALTRKSGLNGENGLDVTACEDKLMAFIMYKWEPRMLVQIDRDLNEYQKIVDSHEGEELDDLSRTYNRRIKEKINIAENADIPVEREKSRLIAINKQMFRQGLPTPTKSDIRELVPHDNNEIPVTFDDDLDDAGINTETAQAYRKII